MMLNREVKNSAFIIATLTSVLYLHGLAFHQGFLRYWGIEESLFPISFERTLVQGYVSYMYLGSKSLAPILFAFIIIFISTFIFNWLAKICINYKFSAFIFKKMEKDKNTKPEKEPLHSFFLVSGWGVIASCIAIVMLIVLLMLSYSSDKQGYQAAIEQHKNFKKNLYTERFSGKVQLLGKKDGYLPKEGNIVVCSAVHCAVYASDKVVIVKVSDIIRVTSEYIK